MVNFYLAKHADDSIVLRPDQDGEVANTMYGDVLGVYPQARFHLHAPDPGELGAAFEGIYQSVPLR